MINENIWTSLFWTFNLKKKSQLRTSLFWTLNLKNNKKLHHRKVNMLEWLWAVTCLSFTLYMKNFLWPYKCPWWRHQIEIFSVLLALCAWNSLVSGEFPSQRTVTWSFDVFFDLHLNKRLSTQSRRRWFEMPSCPLWRHCNVTCEYVRLELVHHMFSPKFLQLSIMWQQILLVRWHHLKWHEVLGNFIAHPITVCIIL